jgi:glutamate synthase domain-containing protein 3
MKFYGVGIVWNPKTNKRLCMFENGVLETEDEEVINQLIERNYKHDGEHKEAPTLEELREKAKELGIKSYASMKYETLIEKIGGLK